MDMEIFLKKLSQKKMGIVKKVKNSNYCHINVQRPRWQKAKMMEV